MLLKRESERRERERESQRGVKERERPGRSVLGWIQLSRKCMTESAYVLSDRDELSVLSDGILIALWYLNARGISNMVLVCLNS